MNNRDEAAARDEAIARIRARVDSWRNNGPKARIGVNLGDLRHVLAALATPDPKSAAVMGLVGMLTRCASQFHFYEASHRAKGTPDADDKARVNGAFVAEIHAALANFEAAAGGDGG